MMANYYEMLRIPKNANDKQVRDAFRKLARKYHPDLNPNDEKTEKRFKQVNEAYEVLSNPINRKKYDKYGSKWNHIDQFRTQQGHTTNNPFPWGSGSNRNKSGFPKDIFESIESIFGEFNSHTTNPRHSTPVPQQLTTQITITLEEAFSGTKRRVSVPSGNRKPHIEVSIPAGVNTGSKVRVLLDKKIELFIDINVASHNRFKRINKDLYVDIEVPFEDAILGGDIQLKTLQTTIRLKIPPESQSGQKIRLKGLGMPNSDNIKVKGDLYVTLRPTLIKNLTDEEKDVIIKLKKLLSSRR